MAEIALGALASAGIGTAGTAAVAAGGGSTILNILAGVATAASVLGSISSANEAARQSEELAAEAVVDEGQQRLQSNQRQNAMRRELMKVLGENDVATAAAGIDVSGGIAQNQRKTATADASRELSIERRDDELRRARLRARAQGLIRRAGSERTAGLLNAVSSIADFGIGVANRG